MKRQLTLLLVTLAVLAPTTSDGQYKLLAIGLTGILWLLNV